MMYMQLTGLCTLSNESLARQKTCQLIAAVCCLHAATNAHTTDLQSVSNVLLVTARVARMYKFCLVCLCVCPGAKIDNFITTSHFAFTWEEFGAPVGHDPVWILP